MSKTWPLQDAKNRLSEVINEALTDGPQTITRRGKETVVVVSVEEWAARTLPKTSLVEFLRRSPLRGVDLDLERERDLGRDVDL